MLVLVFRLGDDLYALDGSKVLEVVPRVPLKRVPHVNPWVAGLFNYRGEIIPVMDMRLLITGEPCVGSLSTRIIMVEHPDPAGRIRRLGLIAEQVTDTIQKAESDFVSAGIRLDRAPYLGGVAIHDKGMLQQLLIDRLIGETLRETLMSDFGDEPAPASMRIEMAE